MKNHWDGMKAEWTLFKQLMRGDTGIGWDATKNTIMADDDWWKRKIKVHFSHCFMSFYFFNGYIFTYLKLLFYLLLQKDVRYRKLRDKDLSLILFRYDALFSDIVATGERTRVANQEQFF